MKIHENLEFEIFDDYNTWYTEIKVGIHKTISVSELEKSSTVDAPVVKTEIFLFVSRDYIML